jgi:FMN phosphatase YigB (HAD superfamily)
MAKPDPAVYMMAAERLGLPPRECVFVDDLDTNVEAARQVGMVGILFRLDKGDDLRSQLAALDVRPRG